MFGIEKQGAVCVLTCDGPLNRDNVEDFRLCLEPHLATGQPMVVVDLRKVPLVDSAGLESLLDVADKANSFGGEVKIAGATSLCIDAMRVTGVDQYLDSYDSVVTAVGSFAR